MTNKKKKRFLPETHPHLIEEWDFEKNEISPEEVTFGSNKKVWWKCSVVGCGYMWEAKVNDRAGVNKSGCPFCNGRVANRYFNLEIMFPKIAAEWSKRNINKKPHDFRPFSKKVVWWECSKCQHEWKSSIKDRSYGKNCPACNHVAVTSMNNLLVLFPDVAKDWHGTKNVFGPEDILPGHLGKVWWKCHDCGYEWMAMVYSRTTTNPRGCPRCSKGPVSKISQGWLDSLDIEIREYYIKDLCVYVDGFDPETNTVYEFFGDYWHGNPKIYSAAEINPSNKRSFGSLFQETMERIRILEDNGYKVVYTWESDFMNSEAKKIEKYA